MKHSYLLIIVFQLFTMAAVAQHNEKVIRLKNGSISTDKNLLNEAPGSALLQRIHHKDKFYALVSFDKLPTTAERSAMAAQGIRLADYVSGKSFMVEMPDKTVLYNLRTYHIGGIYGLDPSLKISSTLSEHLIHPVINPDKLIAVTFFSTTDKASATEELIQTGAQVVQTKIQPEHTVFINASKEVIEKIAALPFVAYIGEQQLKAEPINYYNRGTHGVDALSNPAGRNLLGKNVTIGVGDDADPSTHIDFAGRLILRTAVPPSLHGTHTTGTAAGGGILNQRYRGMAPKATIVSQFFTDILSNTPVYVNDYGMVLTNNSYFSGATGCPGEGEYDVLANYTDVQMNQDLELLHVFAAGNDGGNTCAPFPLMYGTVKSGFQCSKNVLTVGAITTEFNTAAFFSSTGPVSDGRLKPEICAGGWAIISTTPFNNYGADYGTSMAAPTITGSMALLYERYRQLHAGLNPKAALIKALACNSADDLGNPGPDFIYGFGMLNARKAVEALENNHYFSNTISNSGTANFTVTGVPAGTSQLKVMLYWNDPAAAPFAVKALVNDLDLTVTGPDAITHHPLILNSAPANVSNNAVEGIDTLNNIEQVVINNPPPGDFTVTVQGTSIPSGSQDFFVAYELINPTIKIEYPAGNETWVPSDYEVLRWSAHDPDLSPFTLEYSADNGATWSTINNNVSATSRNYLWNAPTTPTNTALVRVNRNGTGLSDVSSIFMILAQPNVTLTNPCPGYANLSWPAVTGASTYDIMVLDKDSLKVIASTPLLNYLVSGLNKDSVYWFSVRGINGTIPGRPEIAQQVIPSGGTCASSTFNNDFTPDSLVAPFTGRMFTSSQLGIVAPQVRIRNLGSVPSSGSYNISYQVNGGSIVTESTSTVIAAASSYTYTFTQAFDFSAVNTYIIKVWVDYTSDGQHANDTLVTVIKQLRNDPLVLNPNFVEGFESATAQSYIYKTMGLDGLDRFDFNNTDPNGRARTFINTGFARTGTYSATLDQVTASNSTSTDSLIATFNLSSYSSSDQLWLDFYFRNAGTDFSAPGNKVWIRGDEHSAWVPVFTLPVNDPSIFGTYIPSTPVNITEVLAAAVPVQTVSSSFQVKFGQQGFTSTNSVITDGNLDDGFSFDDIMLSRTSNDVGMKALVAPNITSICTLTSTEPITVQVKNYSSGTLNNIAVGYNINGNTVIENIASLTAGQVLNYTFTQTADLSAFGHYDMKVWVNYPTDNYRNNDSLVNISFNTVPVITSYPYLEGFESNNGYWYAQGVASSWEWGAPAKVIINKAANGNKAWVTSLTGTYNNSELSYLYSPCFNLSSLTQPVLSFSHIFQTEDNCDCDYHWVEYTTDDVNWIKLGTVGNGTNWYDYATKQAWKISNTKWHVSSYDVPTNASHVRFRIVMSADPGVDYEGIGIDDINVFDKASIYSGPDITSGITQNVSGSNWVNFDLGGNRVAAINPNGQNLGSTTVKAYFNTGPVRFSNNQYYLDRNIVIQPSNVPSSAVSVRFYILDTEVNRLMAASGCSVCSTISDAYESGVTQYSNAPVEENGTLADNLSGNYHFIKPRTQVNVIPYDNGYYAEYQVSNFSEFWINSGGPGQNQSLPQILGPFTVTKKNAGGLLQWTTEQESNTDKFIVEKSNDGITYSAIGEVKAAGNSSNPKPYQFTDHNLYKGINYYRFKLLSLDGQFIYSPVRKFDNSGSDFTIDIFPNPVTKGVVYINTSVNCNRIELTDVSGRVIQSFNTQGNQQVLPVSGLAKGVYFLTVITDNGKKVQKLRVMN